MPNVKITDLTELTSPATDDKLAIVDKSDTTDSPDGTTKYIQVTNLVTGGVVSDDSVTNAKLANMAQSTIKGRAAGAGTGDPTDLTGTQATVILDAMVGDSGSGGTKGLAPAPAAGDAAANKFLHADGTYKVPTGNGISGSTGSTDNALLRADGTGGSTAQASAITVDDNGAITVPEIAAPSTPATGNVAIYAKSDGKLYIKDDAGTETDLAAGGGGVPASSTNIMPYSDGSAFQNSNLTRTSSTVTTINSGVMRGPDGSTSTPTYSFTNQTNGGLSATSTQISVSVTGTETARFYKNGSVPVMMIPQSSGGIIGFGNSTVGFGGFKAAGVGQVKVVADDAGNPGTFFSPTNALGTFGSELVVDMRLGQVREFTMTTNHTIRAPANAIAGMILILRLKQDATGSRVPTWNSAYKWAGGAAPTLTTTANAVDIFMFYLDGTNAEELERKLDVK